MYDSTYYSNFDTTMGTFLGVFLGFFIFIMIIALIVGVLIVIGQWKIFKKGGEEGWKALIPVYNVYTMCKLVGVNPYWVLIVFAGCLFSAIPLLNLVVMVASIYFTVLLHVSLAKAFGKDTGFAIGLILVPYIFYPILGFGKSEFVGADPMEDIIFKNKNNNSTNTKSTTNNTQTVENTSTTETDDQDKKTFCTNCGAQLTKDDNFCTSCGSKKN